LEGRTNYSILRQYNYNMSTKDLLNKYAITDDQKQMINLEVFKKLRMIKLSEYNKMRNLKWKLFQHHL